MKKFAILLATGSALALSACGGGSTTVETNTTTIETNVEDLGTTNVVENVTTPEPAPSPTAAPAPTGKEFDSSTTQDDAEATGMTSRVSRDGDNSSQPAQ